MLDFKTLAWRPDFFGISYKKQEFLKTISSDHVQSYYQIFASNIESYQKLPFIIGKLYYAGWVASQADALAREEVKFDGWDDLNEQEKWDRIDNKRWELAERVTVPQPAFPFNSVQDICARLPERLFKDIAAMYPMQIVGAWAAFEILAGDLWVYLAGC